MDFWWLNLDTQLTMVGCWVPEEDVYWRHYTDLLVISRYLLAPEIHSDEVALVKVEIADLIPVRSRVC